MRLKPPTLVEDYEHVYSGDDAIDHDVEDWQTRWTEARESGNWDLVPTKPGRKPVVWKLRHLRGVPRMRVKDMGLEHARGGNCAHALFWHACRFALAGVVGLLNDRNQPVTAIPQFAESEEWGRANAVTDEFMEQLGGIEIAGEHTQDSLIVELGSVAIQNMGVSKN